MIFVRGAETNFNGVANVRLSIVYGQSVRVFKVSFKNVPKAFQEYVRFLEACYC